MRVFDILALLNPGVRPEETKIHLATWNGRDDPLQVYLNGSFDKWQRWQSRRNFERPFVLSLIAMSGANLWLMAGVYGSRSSRWDEAGSRYCYELDPLPEFEQASGRLVVRFERVGRQSYLNAENWVDSLTLAEYRPEKLTIGEFPGFRHIDLSRRDLETIVTQSPDSWRTALSNVGGIYLISDTQSGNLYVGSATGEGGIWQRWSHYVATGHGGNVLLRQVLREGGPDRVHAFRYALLEVADVHMSVEEILRRESHWKNILLSRAYGLNMN